MLGRGPDATFFLLAVPNAVAERLEALDAAIADLEPDDDGGDDDGANDHAVDFERTRNGHLVVDDGEREADYRCL